VGVRLSRVRPRTRRKKRWSDLSREQRAGIVAAGTVQLGLQATALLDIRRRPAEQMRGHKGAWVALSFLNFVGPIAYFAIGRRR
jgi:Phospholipase_D-nuclease N-terminal